MAFSRLSRQFYSQNRPFHYQFCSAAKFSQTAFYWRSLCAGRPPSCKNAASSYSSECDRASATSNNSPSRWEGCGRKLDFSALIRPVAVPWRAFRSLVCYRIAKWFSHLTGSLFQLNRPFTLIIRQSAHSFGLTGIRSPPFSLPVSSRNLLLIFRSFSTPQHLYTPTPFSSI